MFKAGVAGLFHFVLCSFRLVPGHDAWRHGRFGTRRTVVQCTGFAGGYSPRSMFPSVGDRPKMLDIMAGTDQMYSYVGVWLVCWCPAPHTVFLALSYHGRYGSEVQLCRCSDGLLVLYLALCFFLPSGPRCAASWPLWTRRSLYWQWHVQGWYCAMLGPQ